MFAARLACSLPLLFAQPAAVAPAAAAVTDVLGHYSGTAADGERWEVEATAADQGFAVSVRRAGQAYFSGRFVPTARPGVFEAAATGLFAALGRKRAPMNPLEGEELVWAREVAGGLVLGRLSIENDRPLVRTLRLEREGDRLRLRLERLEGERLLGDAELALEPTGR